MTPHNNPSGVPESVNLTGTPIVRKERIMANYYATVRTNYFHVKSPDEFKKMLMDVEGEDSVLLFEETDENGQPIFGFGCCGTIYGIPKGEDEETDYDFFIEKLQACVADDDAVIILEAGYEKLRYVIATALVVTSSDTFFVSAEDVAIEKAREMLKNDKWDTCCEY